MGVTKSLVTIQQLARSLPTHKQTTILTQIEVDSA